MKTIWTTTLALILSANVSAQQKKIYLAMDDHTDYVWAADEETYRQAFIEMIDYYLDLAERTKNEPPEHQSRFHIGGTFWLWQYERNKSPEDFAKLIARVKSGHISFPLNPLDQTFGGTPTEAVLRGMYYAGDLQRRYGVDIPLAIAMEDQTLPLGLGSLFAGSGARYSWKGICGCLTKLEKTTRRKHEIYWWTGLDDSRLLMKWNTMLVGDSGARTMGGYAEGRTPGREIDFVTKDPRFQEVYKYPIAGIFGKGWDDVKTTSDEFVKTAKSMSTPERKVIVSNMVDFFEDFEKSYGATLPEFTASFGNEWDLYTASITEVSGRIRRSVEKLRGAEALAAMVSQQWPDFMKQRKEQAARAFINLGLFWEHNWTADAKVVTREDRNQWGRRMVSGVEDYVDPLQAEAAYALGGMISGGGQQRKFYVFNPLGWTRSDAADVEFDSSGPVHVIDLSTGEEVPSQVVMIPGERDMRPHRMLRIEARDLPPVGYKVYELRNGPSKAFPLAAQAAGNTIENSIYRLKLEDRGAISSWIDKTRGNREFAGSLENGRSKLNDLGQDPGVLDIENSGPVSVTLRARGESPLKHESRITLYKDSNRIEIRNDIVENFDSTHHWGFSFNLKSPDVWHEELGAIIRAKLLAAGGHYSPDMSRLDYLTLNHFADMNGEGNVGVTLSNWDLAFMKLGDSQMLGTKATLDTATPQIQVLAGGQIDAPRAGIPKQGSDRHFLQRFALRSHGAFDAADSMRFSLEHQNPPIAGWLRMGGNLPAKTHSMLNVSNKNMLLWSFKVAEEGMSKGFVARLWNMSPTPQDYTVALPQGVSAVTKQTHIERDLEAIPVAGGRFTVKAGKNQIQTIRLEPKQ